MVISGNSVATNEDGLINLADLWKIGSGEERLKPNKWLRSDTVSRFVGHLGEQIGAPISSLIKLQWGSRAQGTYAHWQIALASKLKVGVDHIYQTKRGRYGSGTFAHYQVALAYAKYLSPELHMAVNEVFMRYKSGDPKLAEEVIEKVVERRWGLAYIVQAKFALVTQEMCNDR